MSLHLTLIQSILISDLLLINFLAVFCEKTKIVGIIDKVSQDKLEPFIEKSHQDLATVCKIYDPKDADEAREHH